MLDVAELPALKVKTGVDDASDEPDDDIDEMTGWLLSEEITVGTGGRTDEVLFNDVVKEEDDIEELATNEGVEPLVTMLPTFCASEVEVEVAGALFTGENVEMSKDDDVTDFVLVDEFEDGSENEEMQQFPADDDGALDTDTGKSERDAEMLL